MFNLSNQDSQRYGRLMAKTRISLVAAKIVFYLSAATGIVIWAVRA